ncbi:MAG: hypothetical protein ABIQ72_08625 [Usitatibacter sp.]
MRRHWAIAALLALAAALLVAFAWQEGLASLSDDSASYMVLAQAIAGANPAIVPWVGYHTHFPPLFPLLLALTGGSTDLRIAHLAVALLAACGAGLAYRFVLRDSSNRAIAFAVAAAFLLCPTAWVSAKGILSEPMFLCASFACLVYFQGRLEGGRGTSMQWLLFGAMLAAAVLTRVVGATLVAAVVVHLAMTSIAQRKRPAFIALAFALLPPVILVGAWLALKPIAAQDSYERVSTAMAQSWYLSPGLMAEFSLKSIFAGWLATFTADAQVGNVARVVAALCGVLALAGMLVRLGRNRLDAWYVLISLAVIFGWVFSEDNTRRLLYPLLPLLLFYAGFAIHWFLARYKLQEHSPKAIAAAALLLALISVPAMLLLLDKSFDRQPVLAGYPTRYADITEYYSTINVERSRALAGRHAVVLDGLRALEKATPPGARIMWMRPEYIGLLGKRDGIAWYYAWGEKRIAREARDARVDYLVVARLFKTDLSGRMGDPFSTLRLITSYATPVMTLSNPTTNSAEFVLMRVDRKALEAFASGN